MRASPQSAATSALRRCACKSGTTLSTSHERELLRQGLAPPAAVCLQLDRHQQGRKLSRCGRSAYADLRSYLHLMRVQSVEPDTGAQLLLGIRHAVFGLSPTKIFRAGLHSGAPGRCHLQQIEPVRRPASTSRADQPFHPTLSRRPLGEM